MADKPVISAIIVAAGSGVRFGGDTPKQYQLLNGKSMLCHSIEAFSAHPAIAEVRVVIHPDHADYYQKHCGHYKLSEPIMGGVERQESVRNALNILAENAPDYVLVHDAARPFITHAVIDRVIDTLTNHQAAIPVVAVSDTIKCVEGNIIAATPDRTTLKAAQTPQGFHFDVLHNAHTKAQGNMCTDDAAVCEAAGVDVCVVDGETSNRKVTLMQDMPKQVRIGSGFDVHALIPSAGEPMMLCGVAVPCDVKTDGHSDADVGLHALVDAILGSIAAGDIGQHFPPSDAQWKGADSSAFVRHAMSLLQQAGGQLQHIDLTIIGEQPKVSPHREAMRSKIAQLCELPLGNVSVKATTTEKLGFTGRGEGIAAQCSVTIMI